MEASVDREKAIHDYNLLKAKDYGDKFIFLEDVKTLKEFLKKIEFELPKDIRFPQKYEKGIIVSASPYTGINISFGFATASLRLKILTTTLSALRKTASASSAATAAHFLTRLCAS